MTDTTGTAVAAPEILPEPKPPTKAEREILAMKTGHELSPVIPQNIEEAFRFAQMICQARLAPSSYETDGKPDPQKIVVGILTALELGVPPMQGLRGIAIINNRPSVWGDLAIALIQSKGVVQNTEQNYTGDPDTDDYTAHYLMWRKGQENPYEGHFSVKDAKRAGLWGHPKKKPWLEYPHRMLMMRARAFALRDGFSDCLCGLAIAEESQDLPPPAPPAADVTVLDDDVAAVAGEPIASPDQPE